MKKTLVIFAFAAMALGAQDKAPAQEKARPAGLPASAVASDPYTWRYTDAKGTKWLFRQTPFGLSKMEDKPAAAVVEAKPTPTTVTDLGDSVKFSRKTPFGAQTWTKKKADLTDEEKALLQENR